MPTARAVAATAVVAFALLASPFLVFLRFHAAPLATTEVATALAGLGLLALVLAWLFEWGGAVLRAVGCGLLLALLVDVQIEAPRPWIAIAAVFALGSGAAWLLRGRWRGIVAPVAASFLLASALLPVGSALERTRAPQATALDASLPPILHLVLDEQIGVEGIPQAFDPDAAAARSLADIYLERGFRVFGRAYSRYTLSRDSFSAFANRGEHTRYAGTPRRVFLARNAHFEELYARGYAIRVLQTDYLDLCAVRHDFEIEECTTRVLETPRVLADAPLPLGARLRLLAGMVTRLSALLPDAPASRVSALSAMQSFDDLEREVDRLEPGVALFAHVLLPHFPFAYDAGCALRPDPSSWPYGLDWDERAAHFSRASRERRYPLYLEQLACTQRRVAAVLDRLDGSLRARGAWVIVHGDHGSRISARQPVPPHAGDLDTADLVDSFSTLFALRKPGLAGGYDRRILPIDGLLEAALAPGDVPAGRQWLQPPGVVLVGGGARRDVALPEFGRDVFSGPALD